jgi:hypothetical protein
VEVGAIQFKTVRHLIKTEDLWDTLKVVTLVLNPALVALSYFDGMKEYTWALMYSLQLELDGYFFKPIKGLDEAIRTKLYQ